MQARSSRSGRAAIRGAAFAEGIVPSQRSKEQLRGHKRRIEFGQLTRDPERAVLRVHLRPQCPPGQACLPELAMTHDVVDRPKAIEGAANRCIEGMVLTVPVSAAGQDLEDLVEPH